MCTGTQTIGKKEMRQREAFLRSMERAWPDIGREVLLKKEAALLKELQEVRRKLAHI